MPYASKAQQGLFHSPNSPVAPSVVDKFDKESRGQTNLPYHVGGKGQRKPKGAKELFKKKGKKASGSSAY